MGWRGLRLEAGRLVRKLYVYPKPRCEMTGAALLKWQSSREKVGPRTAISLAREPTLLCMVLKVRMRLTIQRNIFGSIYT